jgi:hypothetical protein
MIRRLSFWLPVLVFGVLAASGAWADTFKLTNSQEVSGKVVSVDAQGVVIQKDDGGFKRVAWREFSQEALKELAKRKEALRYVEPLLEPEEDKVTEKKVAPEIPFNPPPRLPRPEPKAGFGSIFSSSVGVVLFVILYLANIYAAYEVSLFRNYHPALVCGLAAVMPMLTQIVFLCVPTRVKPTPEQLTQDATPDNQYVPPPVPVDGVLPDEAGVTPAPGAPAHAPATVYQRGQYTFNRRFFETKLAGFLRVVPAESEKGLVLEVNSLRGTFVAQRIARVMPNDLVLHVQKGGASEDVTVPFGEIREVSVRRKEA